MKKNLILKIFLFYLINIDLRVSPQIFEKIRNGPEGTLRGPGGHWFMKKTWSSKSRVRLPLSKKAAICLSFRQIIDAGLFNNMQWGWNFCAMHSIFSNLWYAIQFSFVSHHPIIWINWTLIYITAIYRYVCFSQKNAIVAVFQPILLQDGLKRACIYSNDHLCQRMYLF